MYPARHGRSVYIACLAGYIRYIIKLASSQSTLAHKIPQKPGPQPPSLSLHNPLSCCKICNTCARGQAGGVRRFASALGCQPGSSYRYSTVTTTSGSSGPLTRNILLISARVAVSPLSEISGLRTYRQSIRQMGCQMVEGVSPS